MALAAFSTRVENIINNVEYGIREWVRNSHVIWISTALTYGCVSLAKEYEWNYGVDAAPAAKFVAITSSLCSLARGVFDTRKELDMLDLKNHKMLTLTNAIALSFGAAHLFK